jgi:hypothetical protein
VTRCSSPLSSPTATVCRLRDRVDATHGLNEDLHEGVRDAFGILASLGLEKPDFIGRSSVRRHVSQKSTLEANQAFCYNVRRIVEPPPFFSFVEGADAAIWAPSACFSVS